MNKIIKKFLLAGDNFLPELHLGQVGFTYSAWRPFTKNKERIQTFKETGDLRHIYQHELDKGFFQHDVSYKLLLDRVFNIAKDPKQEGYQRDVAPMVYTFFS